MTGSWLDSLQATVADFASAALATGEEAGAALGTQLVAALARVQALPDEAALAAADLTAALMGVFPGASHDDSPALAADTPPIGTGSDAAAGQAGPALRTNGPTPHPHPLPRRWAVDPAGLARFLRAQHPDKPAEHAAARTRLPLETVKKILARETLGNGRTLLAFVCAYGPDVLVEALPGVSERWLEGARILHDQVRLDAELARARAAVTANAGRWSFCGIAFGDGA